MTSLPERVGRGIPAGILATLTMDAALVAAARIGGEAWSCPRLGIDVIGRWGAGLARGHLLHDDASLERAQATDVLAGLVTHYATGIALTEAFILAPCRPAGHGRSAVGYGIATAAFPLMVLFPCLGYGFLGLRSGEAARLARIMLLGHVAFGLGIGWGTALLTGRSPVR